MNRSPHILNAATNLLAVCFVIIGGLKFTNMNARSYSDETAWLAALLLFASVMISYLAIRNGGARNWQVIVADAAFLAGIVTLMTAVLIAATVL
jgi:putative effector of murein hydrolase